MNEDLTIQYDRGQITIHLENFLPASQVNLKKLLKINELDWKHDKENLKQVIDYCKKRIEDEQQRKKNASEKYVKNHQPMLDTTRIVENKKMPNGVQLTNEELKTKKEELRHLKAVVDAASSDYKKSERNIKQLQVNLQELEKRNEQ